MQIEQLKALRSLTTRLIRAKMNHRMNCERSALHSKSLTRSNLEVAKLEAELELKMKELL